MGIRFNSIDTSGLTPRHATEFDSTSGSAATPDTTQFLLLVGQRINTAVTPVNTVVDLFSEADGAALFKAGSMLDFMCRAAFAAFPNARISAVAVDDAGGAVAATANVIFGGGAATDDGAVETRIAGRVVRSVINSGDVESVIAARHVADINAIAGLPVTAAVNGGNNKRVDLTAKNKGTHGNYITLTTKLTVSGIGSTTTASAARLSGGTTDPDIAPALAASAPKRCHKVAAGANDATTAGALKSFVRQQSDPDHEKGEIGMQAITTVLSDATTLANGLEHERSMVLWLKDTDSLPCEVAAAVGAVMTSETNPARPWNTATVLGLFPPPVASRPIRTETDNVLANGVTPLVVNALGDVTIMRAVTTKVQNAQGSTDFTLLDVTTITSFDWLRDCINLMIETYFSRANVADDDAEGDLPPDVVTPSKFKIALLNVAREREAEGVCQHVEQLASQIEVDRVGGQLEYQLPADFVPGLMQVFGKVVLFTKALPA
jgi:phage tail sheath gpL-like